MVSANVCESYGVTDAMLTVAVQKKDLSTKRVIQLRVMLHSRCPDQSDFSAERSQVSGLLLFSVRHTRYYITFTARFYHLLSFDLLKYVGAKICCIYCLLHIFIILLFNVLEYFPC